MCSVFFQQCFGVYTEWVNDNLDPNDTGAEKYEKLINNAETTGYLDRQQALEVYAKSMEGEAAFFESVKTVF